MSEQIQALIAAAGRAAGERRWQDAEALWRQVRLREPRNAQAAYSLGVHAHQRGDSSAALVLLEEARSLAPNDPMVMLTLGVVHRDRGDHEAEWNAIGVTLAIDPYFLPGLLAKAEFLDARGKRRPAAGVFRDALKVAGPETSWPDVLRRRLDEARVAVDRDVEELAAFLQQALPTPADAAHPLLAGRWEEAVSIAAGRTRAYVPDCNQLYVPRLPAHTFYDNALFPWIAGLEERTDAIRSELTAILAEGPDALEPYIAYKPGEPVNQWQALNHSRNWSSFHLWAHGAPVHANLARCPVTAQALSGLETVRIAGLCPNAMFSVLAPRTHIPPHHGETNARLVAHLPLIVPPDCSIRVGFDRRGWEPGKVLVFDDSIEHEARNDSDALRAVLIFDVWNPLLSEEEREIVRALANALRSYRESST
ncbi:aspartyl/asparaginyl beta-hydroxylase domain-containing protein [Luteimonas deserti]